MARLSSRLLNAHPLLDSPKWMELADPTLVHQSVESLNRVLENRFGNDSEAKLKRVRQLVEQVKSGKAPPLMRGEDMVALFQVFMDLQLNDGVEKVKEAQK